MDIPSIRPGPYPWFLSPRPALLLYVALQVAEGFKPLLGKFDIGGVQQVPLVGSAGGAPQLAAVASAGLGQSVTLQLSLRPGGLLAGSGVSVWRACFEVIHGPGQNAEFKRGRFLYLVQVCVEVEFIGTPAVAPVPQPKAFKANDVLFYQDSCGLPWVLHHCYLIALAGGPAHSSAYLLIRGYRIPLGQPTGRAGSFGSGDASTLAYGRAPVRDAEGS